MKAKKFIDIGANLTDSMFKGVYNGKKYHDIDLDSVIKKSFEFGLTKIFVTGGSLDECKESVDLVKNYENLYTTVGCHPTRCLEFEQKYTDSQKYFNYLSELIKDNKDKIIAIGEYGLDYDRLNFCRKDIQIKYFEMQFELARIHQLPSFLHSRNCHSDFIEILKKNIDVIDKFGAVVHSFTGTPEEAEELLKLSPKIYIGINGCSLKTSDNLKTVAQIPPNRILIETDSPWCEIKSTHASHQYIKTHFKSKKRDKMNPCKMNTKDKNSNENSLIKGRNEPCTLVQVLEVLEAIFSSSSQPPDDLAEIIYQNTLKLFFPS